MLAYQARHEHHCSGCGAQLLRLLKYSTIQRPRRHAAYEPDNCNLISEGAIISTTKENPIE